MSEQVPAQPAPKNPFARLVGVVVSPGETFAEISRSPGWIAPFAIYLVVFLVCFGVYAAKADWVAIITDQIENSPFIKLVPDANRDQAVAKATAGFRKLSQGQLVASNLVNVGSATLMVGHGFALLWTTLFVMMGSLKDLKLGRAWGRF